MTPANDNAALGEILTLREAAERLKLTTRAVAGVARKIGRGSVFGREMRFTEGDMVAISDFHSLVQRCKSLRIDAAAALSKPLSSSYENICQTYLYVMSCGRFCKVGVSRDVSERLASLQLATPYRISVLESFELRSLIYARTAETLAHKALEDKLVGREWFSVRKERAIEVAATCAELVRMTYDRHDRERAERSMRWAMDVAA